MRLSVPAMQPAVPCRGQPVGLDTTYEVRRTSVVVIGTPVAFSRTAWERSPVPPSRIAIYAGSFDPITRGHEDLMHRSLEFVDRLVVAVAVNSAKTPLFTVEERVELIRTSVRHEPRIEVHSFDGLLVDFARQVKASLLIRGLRAVSDFEYEYQMALMNRHLSPKLETVFMVPSLDTTYISASLVREVARYGGKVSDLVHPVVAEALKERLGAAPQRK